MKFTRLGVAVLLTLAALARAADPEPPAGPEISAADGTGELEIDTLTGTATASNGVVIRHEGATLTARKVTLSRDLGEVLAEGDVVLVSGEGDDAQVVKGETIRYQFATRQIRAGDVRLGQAPFFASVPLLEGSSESQAYSATGGWFTTDDLAEPGFRIKARSLVVEPGERITARGATFYVRDVPVFHWPVYSKSLRSHSNFWTVSPGYRSVFGAFAEATYHWQARTNALVTLDLDTRTERGFAGGPGVEYDLGRWGKGGGRLYYADDWDPYTTALGQPVVEDRRMVSLRHSLTNATGFSFKARFEEQNDPLIRRDFFEYEFRRDLQPRTFVEANQAWSDWTLDALVQPQVNDFFQTVERLPDLKLTGLRQQIGAIPVYYESESSVAYLRFRPGLLGGTTNYAGLRTDTYHQLVAPRTFFGWLNFLPRVGGRYTYYGDPEGDDPVGRDQARWLFNTGAEFTAKASRTWSGATNRVLEVSGLRHIVQPSINYVFVPAPDVRPMRIPQYDFEYLTPRLLPVEFPDYNAVDSIDTRNVIRWTLRNRLQTRRVDGVEDLVNWAVYTDWRLDPRAGQTTFPDLYSDLDFAPRSWLLLNSQIRYDIHGTQWREANHRLTIQPGDVWSWTLGHRYLENSPATYGPGNNLIYSSLYYRLNENWGFRASHLFEARDGMLEEQHYAVYRDLRSWTAALGLRIRDNRQAFDDWAIVFSIQLKAFPSWRLNDDRDVPERIFGG